MHPALTEQSDGVALRVKVVPGASRTRVAGMLGDRLKVAVAAPPEKGKANDAVCDLIAQTLGIAKAQVNVISGQTRPLKTLSVIGLSLEQVAKRLH